MQEETGENGGNREWDWLVVGTEGSGRIILVNRIRHAGIVASRYISKPLLSPLPSVQMNGHGLFVSIRG